MVNDVKITLYYGFVPCVLVVHMYGCPHGTLTISSVSNIHSIVLFKAKLKHLRLLD